MSDFGLTPLGYFRKRQDDIIEEIEQALEDAFGPVNTEPDSVFGQLVGIFSLPIAQLYQDVEDVYFSMYPATAEGVSLDNAVELVGISRLEATSTRVIAAVTGTEGTFIPANSQAELIETGEVFTNPAPGTITRNNAVIVNIFISAVVNDADYTIIINGQPLTYNSGPSADLNDILVNLVNLISISSQPVSAQSITPLGTIEIESDNFAVAFSVSISPNLVVNLRTSPLEFVAQETGPIVVPEKTLTEIVTPVSGWDEITNLIQGVTGRNTETDQELRIRRLDSLRVIGAASVPAIRARLLQQVQDVVGVFIFENREPFEVAGRPPHSFEAVVVGGLDQEIADLLWQVKPAGIQTFGNVSVNVTDSNGDIQEIRFSRPTPLYIWAQLEIRVQAGVFPTDGVTSVRNSVVAYGDTLNVGDKVIYQKIFDFIYQTQGILEVDLELATSSNEAGPPGPFTIGNVSVPETSIALFAFDRVSVSVV